MRVAELTGVRRFRLVEQDIAEPGPGQVQVRVEAIGVCGSDVHSYAEGSVGDTPCAYPMVLGHEPAGVVAKVGTGVTGWSAGDQVACEPALYCYHCELCMAGRHNICTNLKFLSTPGHPGFFRDRVNLPAHNLLALPARVGTAEGTLIEPLSVVLHSLALAQVGLGETVVVFGCGPIGLLTIGALKLSGAGRVWAVEPVAERREMARAIGADVALATGREILADSRGRGVDVAFDCAAKGDTVNECIRVARNGGRVVYTAIPVEVRVPLEFHPWRRKELVLYQVRRSNREWELARDLLAAHTSRFAAMITHQRELADISGAFVQAEHYEDGVGKLVLRAGQE